MINSECGIQINTNKIVIYRIFYPLTVRAQDSWIDFTHLVLECVDYSLIKQLTLDRFDIIVSRRVVSI